MFANFKKKLVKIYKDNGQIIRQFSVAAEVVDAVVTGGGKDAKIAITMKNGKTVIYKSNGQIVRQI